MALSTSLPTLSQELVCAHCINICFFLTRLASGPEFSTALQRKGTLCLGSVTACKSWVQCGKWCRKAPLGIAQCVLVFYTTRFMVHRPTVPVNSAHLSSSTVTATNYMPGTSALSWASAMSNFWAISKIFGWYHIFGVRNATFGHYSRLMAQILILMTTASISLLTASTAPF